MSFIFGMSGENGTDSSALSEKAVVIVAGAVAAVTDLDEDNPEVWERLKGNMHYYVRKAAHMLEYAILGLLLVLTLSSYGISGVIIPWIAVFIGVIYAVSDEYHQTFVAGRAGQLMDVLIDSVGLLTGVLIASVLVGIAGLGRLIFGKKSRRR